MKIGAQFKSDRDQMSQAAMLKIVTLFTTGFNLNTEIPLWEIGAI